ncbi:unnamed protein product, partial [Symbiodinium sp. KB8]
DGRVLYINAEDLSAPPKVVDGHKEAIGGIAADPVAGILATVDLSGRACIWKKEGNAMVATRVQGEGHKGYTTLIAAADGHFASYGNDQVIRSGVTDKAEYTDK